MDNFFSFYLLMTTLYSFFLIKCFLIVLHLLNKRNLVDLDKDKYCVSLVTLFIFDRIPSDIDTKYEIPTVGSDEIIDS